MSGEASPQISIGRISITGVDQGTARALGPAIERVVGDAARSGRLAEGHHAHLRLDLSAGTSAHDIARALARAIERR